MLSGILRKPVECFYCGQTLRTRPPNPNSFQCPNCECWNRYDRNGEIMSDEPAMHDESLNSQAFARRASPNKNALPSSHTKSLFCRTCQTNQTLYINLVSNYLPDEDDPLYPSLLAQFPAYRQSLEERYPTVCVDCVGGVEEEIRKAERRSRATALGYWLKDGRKAVAGDVEDEKSPAAKARTSSWSLDVLVWRIRGLLWCLSIAVSIGGSIHLFYPLINTAGWRLPSPFLLPVFTTLSVLWAFWDPTWHRVRMARLRSEDLRVQGRERWIVYQGLSWLLRIATSTLIALWSAPRWWFTLHAVLEILVLGLSWLSIRVTPPPSVRLGSSTSSLSAPKAALSSMRKSSNPAALFLRNNSRKRDALTPYPTSIIPTRSSSIISDTSRPNHSSSRSFNGSLAPKPAEPDGIFSSLSLSGAPPIHHHSSQSLPDFGSSTTTNIPAFGQTSSLAMPPSIAAAYDEEETRRGEGEMDWEEEYQPSSTQDWIQLHPQRLFPKAEPTGLEGLLEQAKIRDPRDSAPEKKDVKSVGGRSKEKGRPAKVQGRAGAVRRDAGSVDGLNAMRIYGVGLLVVLVVGMLAVLGMGRFEWTWRVNRDGRDLRPPSWDLPNVSNGDEQMAYATGARDLYSDSDRYDTSHRAWSDL